MDDLKETRGYWKLKEEALDRTVCSIPFGRGCGRFVRQNTECVYNQTKTGYVLNRNLLRLHVVSLP